MIFSLFILFIYFLAALGLCCCARAFSSCGERGATLHCSVRASHCGGFSFSSLALLPSLQVNQGWLFFPNPFLSQVVIQSPRASGQLLSASELRGGQGSREQVLTVILPDKGEQLFSSEASELELISGHTSCFLPEWPGILPGVKHSRLGGQRAEAAREGETAGGRKSQLINIIQPRGGGDLEPDMQTYAKSYVDYPGFRVKSSGGLAFLVNRNTVLLNHMEDK